MAEYTKNLNLEKPSGNDNFRRQVLNDNMDKIDQKFGNGLGEGHVHDGTTGHGKQISYNNLQDRPEAMRPTTHKSSHAKGGSDTLLPIDIGAAEQVKFDTYLADYANLKAQVESPTYSAENTTTAVVTSMPATAVKAPFSKFVLKGNAAQNLVANGNFANGLSGWWKSPTETSFTISNNEASFTASATFGGVGRNLSIIANHTYYIMANVKASSSLVRLVMCRTSGYDTIIASHSGSGNYDILSAKGTMVDLNNPFIMVMDCRSSGWSQVKVKDVMAIDLTVMGLDSLTVEQCNQRFANWFDGMQGTGGQKVTVAGRNLFDKNKVTQNNYVDVNTGNLVNTTTASVSDWIYIEPSIQYIRSGCDNQPYAFYNNNKNFISGGYVHAITTPNNARYIRTTYSNTEINSIKLEKGTIATAYEPYTETSVLTPDIGYSLPNGVCDEIDILTGKKIQNCSKVVLNGGETWGDNGTDSTDTKLFYFVPPLPLKTGKAVCDKFISTADVIGNPTGAGWEGVYCYSGAVFLKIFKSRLSTQDVTGFKAWLAANPTTVIYQLATPITTNNPSKQLVAEPNGQIVIESGWKEKVLQTSDITSLLAVTNIDRILTSAISDYAQGNNRSGNMFIEGWTQTTIDSAADNTSFIGKFYVGPTKEVVFCVAKGAYSSLAQAQKALSGTVITYQTTNSGTLPTLTESHAISVKAQMDCNTDAIARLDEKADDTNVIVTSHKAEYASAFSSGTWTAELKIDGTIVKSAACNYYKLKDKYILQMVQIDYVPAINITPTSKISISGFPMSLIINSCYRITAWIANTGLVTVDAVYDIASNEIQLHTSNPVIVPYKPTITTGGATFFGISITR